jgi:hypothetical protein
MFPFFSSHNAELQGILRSVAEKEERPDVKMSLNFLLSKLVGDVI